MRPINERRIVPTLPSQVLSGPEFSKALFTDSTKGIPEYKNAPSDPLLHVHKNHFQKRDHYLMLN